MQRLTELSPLSRQPSDDCFKAFNLADQMSVLGRQESLAKLHRLTALSLKHAFADGCFAAKAGIGFHRVDACFRPQELTLRERAEGSRTFHPGGCGI